MWASSSRARARTWTPRARWRRPSELRRALCRPGSRGLVFLDMDILRVAYDRSRRERGRALRPVASPGVPERRDHPPAGNGVPVGMDDRGVPPEEDPRLVA